MGSTEGKKAEEVEESTKDEASDDIERQDRVSKTLRFVRITTNVMLTLTIAIFVTFLTNSFLLGDKYVEKQAIDSEITALIKNGAGLRAVRFHYDHRDSVKRDILFSIKHDLSLYYKYEVALSEILERLRTEQFLNGTPDDVFITKLDGIITEYTESNPFDKLEAGQKDLFENIRVKLNGNYSTVSDDVNKLSDELDNKNKLVNEYLSDSQTSLIVSIVSAFIAVILAGIQMWQNRSNSIPLRHGSSISKSQYVSENANGERVVRTQYSDGRVMEKVYKEDGTVTSTSRRSTYS